MIFDGIFNYIFLSFEVLRIGSRLYGMVRWFTLRALTPRGANSMLGFVFAGVALCSIPFCAAALNEQKERDFIDLQVCRSLPHAIPAITTIVSKILKVGRAPSQGGCSTCELHQSSISPLALAFFKSNQDGFCNLVPWSHVSMVSYGFRPPCYARHVLSPPLCRCSPI